MKKLFEISRNIQINGKELVSDLGKLINDETDSKKNMKHCLKSAILEITLLLQS